MKATKSKPKCVDGMSCGASCISGNKHCDSTLSGTEKTLAQFLHQADHLGENVVSWKVGKIVGSGIAQLAIAAGVPTEIANIVSESVVQAGAAAAIHATKNTRKTGEFDAKDTASHFVQQLAAAAIGKISHHGMEGVLEYQAAQGIVTTLAPLFAGKGMGIFTAAKMKSSGLDGRIVDYVTERSKSDISRIRSIFAPRATASLAEFADVDKDALQILFDLSMATYILVYQASQEAEPA